MTRTFVVVDGSGRYQTEKPNIAAKKAAARLFKKTTIELLIMM